MNRLYHRISTLRLSSLIIAVIAVSAAVFLFGGGLYDVIVQPLPSFYSGGSFLFLYPSLGDQFISDSIIAITLYAIGVIGLVIVYQSTKYAYKPRQAYMMFLIGVVLLFMAYILLETTISLKLSGK
jgi:membrane protein CcdC involved in cytochrome C biogenesis